MLTELRVRELGVIRDLTLRLGPGMTVLTGETGAGKTLVVEALQLVTGGRASSQLVRADAPELLVEARFELPGSGPDDERERLLARAVSATGRSRAWVGGRMAPVSALADLGETLVDIHGQHEHQALSTTVGQRRALDAFAGTDLGGLTAARQVLVALERRLDELGGDDRQRARDADMLRHQVAEIDGARITDLDEELHLAAEEARLADLSALREAAEGALVAMEGVDAGGLPPSALGTLGDAVTALGGREVLAEWEDRLRSVLAEVADVASDLRRTVDGWEEDPARLAEVQARRRLLSDLRRKYGESLAAVVAFAEECRHTLVAVEERESLAADLQAQLAGARRDVEQAEQDVRRTRRGAAPGLGVAVTDRLVALAMADARLEVEVADTGAGDAVQFLLAANPGEVAHPLAKVASGGELARTMLALRLVTGGGAPTALFDEVDAGVGGSAALALAQALREVADARQVLVVTHLAQVAAVADHHYAVRKEVGDDGRTVTTAEALSGEARVVELSRMLSGHPDSPTARAHAEELLARPGHGLPGQAPGPRPRRGGTPRNRGGVLERSTTAGVPSE